MTALTSSAAGRLSGTARPPGDKSISHRALILGALSVGETRIEGLLESADVKATAAALRAMGAGIEAPEAGAGGATDSTWRVFGRGVGGLAEPAGVLDMGNSGTACRLLMGVVAGHPMTATFSGDASLSERPMERVMAPLRQMGAAFTARAGGRLPITVTGSEAPIPIEYTLPVASAQVKSAVLLAGLGAPGETTVVEPQPTRDHTERMLGHFGAEVRVAEEGAGRRVTVKGQPELSGAAVAVPADVSSAAFPLVAALLVPGSDVRLLGVGVNPLRAGLLETLAEMGAEIMQENAREEGGEPVCDIVARASALKAVDVPADRAPSMIDEYPILAVAAALATGTTRMAGLAELRVKESDRLAAIANGLRAAGVQVEETEDTLCVTGSGGKPVPGGAVIEVAHDHRIAMAFLILGMVSEAPIGIDNAATIDTSFPGFGDLMNGLGAQIRETDA